MGRRCLATALAAGVLLAGCGNRDVVVPPECMQGPASLRAALRSAPGPVLLGGRARIRDCFKQAAPSADVQNLGSIFIETADGLGDRVRRAPRSHAAVELGYLMGAVRRGARTDSGIHYQSEQRIEQSLVGVPLDTPEYRRGLAAGKRSG
jgi:hypothetical protein